MTALNCTFRPLSGPKGWCDHDEERKNHLSSVNSNSVIYFTDGFSAAWSIPTPLFRFVDGSCSNVCETDNRWSVGLWTPKANHYQKLPKPVRYKGKVEACSPQHEDEHSLGFCLMTSEIPSLFFLRSLLSGSKLGHMGKRLIDHSEMIFLRRSRSQWRVNTAARYSWA